MTEFNQICYWDSEKEESVRELVSNKISFLLVINLNNRVIREIEPFNLLKRLFDIGVRAIDFQKENSKIDTVAADKWLMRAYDDNEGSFNLSIKCFDDIRDKLINGESLSSLLNNNIISEAVAKQIFSEVSSYTCTSDDNPISLEDLIINEIEGKGSILPTSHLELSSTNEPGDILPLVYKFHNETVEMNMDDAYNVSNLLFMNDHSELQAVLNKNNKLLYLPHFYKKLLSDNPDKKFPINLKVIEEHPSENLSIPFQFPNKVRYKVFDSIKYGNIDLGGNGIFYLCLNLPSEYYLTHYKEFEHLLYNTDTEEFESNGKIQNCLQYLINDIAENGFLKPLIFKVNRNGQLRGIANKCRIMIARYLQLPTIPAVIVSYPDEGYVNSQSGNYRNLAEKYLSPYLLLPEIVGEDLFEDYADKDTTAYKLLSNLPEDLFRYLADNFLIKRKDMNLTGNCIKGSIFQDGSYFVWRELYHDYFYHNFGLFEQNIEYEIIKLTDILGEVEAYRPKIITEAQRKTLNKFKRLIDIKEVPHLPMPNWNII